jgi:hypothetical protein
MVRERERERERSRQGGGERCVRDAGLRFRVFTQRGGDSFSDLGRPLISNRCRPWLRTGRTVRIKGSGSALIANRC